MSLVSVLTTQVASTLIGLLKRLDPQCWDNLKPHNGKTICFHIDELPPLYFQIKENQIQTLSASVSQCDTTFCGPLSTFTSSILTKNQSFKNLLIRGDLECAKALYDAWHHVDIDWEGHLATIVGDNLAHTINQGFIQAKEWTKQTCQYRQEDLSIYLQDEVHLLPTKEETETLFNQIDVLRHDVERFEAKFNLFAERVKDN